MPVLKGISEISEKPRPSVALTVDIVEFFSQISLNPSHETIEYNSFTTKFELLVKFR